MRIYGLLAYCWLCISAIGYSAGAEIDDEVAILLSNPNPKYTSATEKLEALPPDERSQSARLITLARCYAASSDLTKSEAVLREHIDIHGNETIGYIALGKLMLSGVNRTAEAVKILKQGEKKAINGTEDPSLLVILGKAIANDPDSAAAASVNKLRMEEAWGYAERAEGLDSSDAMTQ